MMRFLSVCSGLGGAELAFAGLGWECAGVAEVDPAACAVLAHHWPNVKNFGDFTKIGVEDVGAIDLLVGGTPCQDFSVAGLRAGVEGGRHDGVMTGMQVRRLTPTECARLQAVPDDHLNILYRGKPLADGPKYKLLGNGFCINVVRWIGKRLDAYQKSNC